MVQTVARSWIHDAIAARDGLESMLMLRAHYKGEAKLDVLTTKAQQDLDTLVYTNKPTVTFKAMITRLNKAYIILKKHGQDYTDKSKVEQLAKRIKNPGNNIQVTVVVETMREAHKANFTAAVQYITARMAQINTAGLNTPGPNPWRINEDNTNRGNAPRTEFNGVNIRNPFRTFTELKLARLGERGQALVEDMKQNHNNGR